MKLGISTLLVCLVSSASAAFASTIYHIDSRPGVANSRSAGTVAITPHSAWEPNNPVNPGDPLDNKAVWVSYGPTGYGESHPEPFGDQIFAMSVSEDFSTSGAAWLRMNVWADDTARVVLDGDQIIAPVFSQSTCSGAPIGCRPQDFGVINQAIGAGNHHLVFQVFQVGTGTDTTSNPFGLLYTGTVAAPEPGTLALGGLGLAVAAGFSLKKYRKSANFARATVTTA